MTATSLADGTGRAASAWPSATASPPASSTRPKSLTMSATGSRSSAIITADNVDDYAGNPDPERYVTEEWNCDNLWKNFLAPLP